MKASIIIRCKDEAAYINGVLDGIFAQRATVPYEVIVIDSGSTDGTLDIVSKYPCKLIQIPPERFGYGYTMNLGAGEATGDILVFVSAHCPPVDGGWLAALIAPFSESAVAGSFGRQIPGMGGNPFDGWRLLRAFPETDVHPHEHAFSSANAAVRKSVWEAIRFDESLPFSEDREWAKQAAAKGYGIAYALKSRVYHLHKFGMKGVRERAYAAGYAKKKIYGDSCRFDSRLWIAGAFIYCVFRDFAYFARNGYWGYMKYIFKYRAEELAGFYDGAIGQEEE